MPKAAERQIKRQGGTARYRTVKSGGETMTCAVTKKAGPRGGRTVCWKKGTSESAGAALARQLLEGESEPMERHQVVLGAAIHHPAGLSTHEAIQAFLEAVPERLGPVVLNDLRVLRGMVDADGCPVAQTEPSYAKVR